MIIFSDIHFHQYPAFAVPWKDGCNSRLKSQLDTLADIFRIVEELNETTLVFLGDLFHSWKILEPQVYSKVTSTIKSLIDKHSTLRDLIVLIGNHDMINKRTPNVHPLQPFKWSPKIRVVDEPARLVLEDRPCYFIPYNEDIDYVHDLLSTDDEDAVKQTYLFSHLDIIGARTGIDGYSAKGGLPTDLLFKYAGGIFGHYHMHQHFRKDDKELVYVGSPMQLGKINIGEEHGILQFKDGQLKFIALDSPRFVYVDKDTDPGSLRDIDYHLLAAESADELRETEKKFDGLMVTGRVIAKPATPVADRTALPAEELIDRFMQEESLLNNINKEVLISWAHSYT